MTSHRPDTDPIAGSRQTEKIALILSVGWLVFVGAFFLFVPVNLSDDGIDPLRTVMVMLAIFLPVAIIWIASLTARSARMMHGETERLHQIIEALQDEVAQTKQPMTLSPAASVERKLTKIAQSGKRSGAQTAPFRTQRGQDGFARHTEDEPKLALGVPPEDDADPLPRVDLIRALNFPDTEADTIGFAALRKALKDRTARQLVQASQDVLTLLSQDGIYMDDLNPDRSRPELWRRFAQGERGRVIGALGGVRDRTSLALTAARMREDPIFRDAAHHFLRNFDRMLTSFELVASDAELIELADTRTARAFMLLGRVTGAFD